MEEIKQLLEIRDWFCVCVIIFIWRLP
jgi:hypothetical protein